MSDFISSLFQQFLQTSLLEWIATLSGFICVYLAAKQHILNWPISMISVSIYLYIFYHSKLYGDSALQLYFLATAIYGWYYWNKRKQTEQAPISSLSIYESGYSILAIALLSFIIGSLLSQFTDTDVPYIDGFCTATSLVAQFLLSRKIVQNWLLWVLVDICYVPLYIHKGLLLTAILYIAFTIIAWSGYKDWKKTYKKFD